MNSFKIKLTIGLVALALCIVDWSEAQKTIANSFQQTVNSGYQQQRQSPAKRVQQSSRRTEVSYQQQQPAFQPQQSYSASSSSSSYESSGEADSEPATYGAVSGKPGVDFPAYTQVPKTSFSCDGLPYDYGMYADEETGCQAYHLCYNGRKESFLCGIGTVFNQRILHCDYWYSVECGKSSQYYSSNAYMGSSQPEPGPAQANSDSQSSYSSSSSRTQSKTVSRPVPATFQNTQQSSYRNTQQSQESY